MAESNLTPELKKQIEVGDHVEIQDTLYRVIRVKPNSGRVTLEAVARVKKEAQA